MEGRHPTGKTKQVTELVKSLDLQEKHPPIAIRPMDQVPLEVWEKLFEYLITPKDMLSVSRTSPVWKDATDSTRSDWMFGLAFPFLLKYLSKTDVLQCRAVSRFWRRGVDYFLFNNHVHRTGLEFLDLDGNTTDQIDTYHGSLWWTLHKAELLRNTYDFENGFRFIVGVFRYHDPIICPFILRSVVIRENLLIHRANKAFLEALGSHIWFIRIVAEDMKPEICLAGILDLLQHLPNLKKLELRANNIPEDPDMDLVPEMERVFVDFVNENVTAEFVEMLPKLESVNLGINGPCLLLMMDVLMHMFCNENLISVEMSPMTQFQQLDTSNLVDLGIRIHRDIQVPSLLEVDAPIRQLRIHAEESVNAALIFKVVFHFQATLQHLVLQFEPPNLSSEEDDDEEEDTEDLAERLLPFMDSVVLNGVSNVKSLAISGVRPASVISLNFILGLKQSLEHLTLHIGVMDNRADFLKEHVPQEKQKEEILDLLERLRLRYTDKLAMYRSNVWSIFPKLKVLTVQPYPVKNPCLEENGEEEEDKEFKNVRFNYRRDDADKLRCHEQNNDDAED